MPIVVYSASSQMTVIRAAYRQGADLYLVKPFHPLHLKNALQAILSRAWLPAGERKQYYFINNRFVPFTAAIN